MKRLVPLAALVIVIVLAVVTPAFAALQEMEMTEAGDIERAVDDPPYAPEGGVTEDGLYRAGFDIFVDCRSGYSEDLEEMARACREAGFPMLNDPAADSTVPAGTLPQTGGAPLLVLAFPDSFGTSFAAVAVAVAGFALLVGLYRLILGRNGAG